MTLSGENFRDPATVTFSGEGVAAEGVEWRSSNELRVNVTVAQDAPKGPRNVTVTNPDRTSSTCKKCFVVKFPKPQISSTTRLILDQGKNASLRINGTNFDEGVHVSIRNPDHLKLRLRSRSGETDISLQLTAAASAKPGLRDLIVSNPDGQKATCKHCVEITIPTGCTHEPIRTDRIEGNLLWETIKANDDVPRDIPTLKGVSEGVLAGTDIWTVVYSHVSDKFYPQSRPPLFGPATPLAGGHFRSSAAFGGKPGEKYDVAVSLAGPKASEFLSDTLRAWWRSKDFRGLSLGGLPKLHEKHCVVVTLKD